MCALSRQQERPIRSPHTFISMKARQPDQAVGTPRADLAVPQRKQLEATKGEALQIGDARVRDRWAAEVEAREGALARSPLTSLFHDKHWALCLLLRQAMYSFISESHRARELEPREARRQTEG